MKLDCLILVIYVRLVQLQSRPIVKVIHTVHFDKSPSTFPQDRIAGGRRSSGFGGIRETLSRIDFGRGNMGKVCSVFICHVSSSPQPTIQQGLICVKLSLNSSSGSGILDVRATMAPL
jgi:hypothetical protein